VEGEGDDASDFDGSEQGSDFEGSEGSEHSGEEDEEEEVEEVVEIVAPARGAKGARAAAPKVANVKPTAPVVPQVSVVGGRFVCLCVFVLYELLRRTVASLHYAIKGVRAVPVAHCLRPLLPSRVMGATLFLPYQRGASLRQCDAQGSCSQLVFSQYPTGLCRRAHCWLRSPALPHCIACASAHSQVFLCDDADIGRSSACNILTRVVFSIRV
jgi:hypothetical protein